MNKKKKIIKRVLVAILIVMIAAIIALAYTLYTTDVDTLISTGKVDLNFNDGIVVFADEDLKLSPSETVIREMFIENAGEEPFYYRIYLDNMTGDLIDSTVVNIYDDEGDLLLSVETAEFDSSNYFTTGEILEAGERVDLSMEIVVLENAGNVYQESEMNFDIIVTAIQSKNNIIY